MRYDDYALAPDPYSKLADLISQAQDQTLDPAQRTANQGEQNKEIGKMLQSALGTIAAPKQQSAIVKSVNNKDIQQMDKAVELVDYTKPLPAVAEVAHSDTKNRIEVMANHVASVVDYVSLLGANPPSTQAPWRP